PQSHMDSQHAIEIQGLCKRFGPKVAVDHLDMVLPTGKLYGLIGPNGAGKTTSIRMILSIIFPDAGRLSVLGKASASESKDRIGYLPEERGVYRKMKVKAFLSYMATLKGVRDPKIGTKIDEWLDRVGLADVAKKRCEELSKGMQQKVQFIATVIHDPELLILDEPFSGLDPVNLRLLRDLIKEQHAMGKTVIFSTHVMHHAEQICDHIVMINGGKKVLDADLPTIRASYPIRSLLIDPLDTGADLGPLDDLPFVVGRTREETAWELTLDGRIDPTEALRTCASTIPLARVELRRPTLEDVFIEKATSEGTDEAELREALRVPDAGGIEAEGVTS
ncbi:MAG: ATP-binding cassette domain-containing protein, partial [Planctomycetota bacterium]